MDYKEYIQYLRSGDQQIIAGACKVSHQLVSKVVKLERRNRLVEVAIIELAKKNLQEEKNISSLLLTSIKRKKKNKKRLVLKPTTNFQKSQFPFVTKN